MAGLGHPPPRLLVWIALLDVRPRAPIDDLRDVAVMLDSLKVLRAAVVPVYNRCPVNWTDGQLRRCPWLPGALGPTLINPFEQHRSCAALRQIDPGSAWCQTNRPRSRRL